MRPLGTQPLEAGLWGDALPVAPHVEYRTLPQRPPHMVGQPLFGWVPSEWVERHRIETTVCHYCEDGEEERGNFILLCDGDGCHRGFHMGCLDPPLVRMPAKNRDWFCPLCKAEQRQSSAPRPPGRQPASRNSAAAAPAEAPSAYELQRLENIARNQRMLQQLGLG